MAKLIKCPRCQTQIDVTNVAGGSTVRCSDCDALVRVSTGQTGQVPVAAAAPAPQAAAPAPPRVRAGRSSQLFRKMSNVRAPGERGRPPSRASIYAEREGGGTRYARRGSNTPLVIGLSLGGVGLIVLLAVLVANKKDEPRKQAPPVATKQIEEQEQEQEQVAPPAPKKGPSMVKKADGKYDVPTTFEKGARKVAEKTNPQFYEFNLDAAKKREYEALASGGKVADIVNGDSTWIPFVIESLLSEDEAVARSSFQALHDICVKRKISSAEDTFRNPVKMEFFNSSYARAGEYNFWSSNWWAKPGNQDAARSWAPGAENIAAADPQRENWEETMKFLRAGGGFDDPKRPEGLAFMRVKTMGKGAYPHLIKFIDHEDIGLGKAAVVVLNELTGRKTALPTEANKAQIKTEWETWIKSN